MANYIFNIGVDDNMLAYKQKLVKFTNIYAFCTLIFTIVLSIYLSFYSTEIALRSLTLLVPALAPFLLNYLGLFSVSRFVFTVSFSWFLSNLHAYIVVTDDVVILQAIIMQFVLTILPWVIIDIREKYLLIISVASTYIIFLLFPLINDYVNASQQSEIVNDPIIHNLILFLSVLFSIIFLLQLQFRGIEAENNNNKLLEDLNKKNDELEQQENELQKTLDEINEKRKEDDRRNWSATGITMVNKVLRTVTDEDLYNKLISELVKYMKGFQGAIYTLEGNENEDKYLKLYGSYAFQYEYMKQDEIPLDEGYLGQVYSEMAEVYLEELPEDYIRIQSSLGDSTPESLLLMPMIQEGEFEGIIELAFLRKLQQYEIDFLEEVALILARFIESHQVNTKTRTLLEETQQQTEEMRAQEEEMRQNMEELQATQEEMRRKEKEYVKRIEELEDQLST